MSLDHKQTAKLKAICAWGKSLFSVQSFKFKGLLLVFLLQFIPGWSQESPIVDRLNALEQQTKYFSKKQKTFHGIFGAEFLYWKADVEGVAYATTSKLVQTQGSFGNQSTTIKTRTPHFHFEPGFRLMVGVQSPFDLFDVVFVWTRQKAEGHDRARGTLVPAIPLPGDKLIFDDIGLIKTLTSIPNKASARCHLRVNLLDLQLGRGIDMSQNFFFRPYFGVRVAWSDVDWRISISRNFIFPGVFAQESTQLKVENDFQAVGGLFGMTVDWKLPLGFGLNTRAAGALVYGRTEESTRQKFIYVPQFSQEQFQQNYRAHNSFHSVKALWELFGGVYWQTKILKPKKYRTKHNFFQLRLLLGYEFQQWPTLAQKTNIQFSRERERFSLGFEGLTGGAWLAF